MNVVQEHTLSYQVPEYHKEGDPPGNVRNPVANERRSVEEGSYIVAEPGTSDVSNDVLQTLPVVVPGSPADETPPFNEVFVGEPLVVKLYQYQRNYPSQHGPKDLPESEVVFKLLQ